MVLSLGRTVDLTHGGPLESRTINEKAARRRP